MALKWMKGRFLNVLFILGVFSLMVNGCTKDTMFRSAAPTPESPPGYPKPYRVMGRWYQPLPHAEGYKERGIASWYGEDFHGMPTSSGEIFDMNKISAAHKILPLGTYVRVKNLRNGRQLVIRINDRGPFIGNRVIDLSRKAAQVLGVYGPGTAPVDVVALSPSPGGEKKQVTYKYKNNKFSVQVGAFGDLENAEKLRNELAYLYGHAQIKPIVKKRNLLYRVCVGDYSTLRQAEKYEYILKKRGFNSAFIVVE